MDYIIIIAQQAISTIRNKDSITFCSSKQPSFIYSHTLAKTYTYSYKLSY